KLRSYGGDGAESVEEAFGPTGRLDRRYGLRDALLGAAEPVGRRHDDRRHAHRVGALELRTASGEPEPHGQRRFHSVLNRRLEQVAAADAERLAVLLLDLGDDCFGVAAENAATRPGD